MTRDKYRMWATKCVNCGKPLDSASSNYSVMKRTADPEVIDGPYRYTFTHACDLVCLMTWAVASIAEDDTYRNADIDGFVARSIHSMTRAPRRQP